MLRRGGNAFDAAVSAALTACVAEPCLTSLAGGGFLLSYEARTNQAVLYDFFVNSPGLGREGTCEGGGLTPHFLPVDVDFGSTVQVFHAGHASVAVPGQLKGLMTCFEDLCTMQMDDLVAPALRALEQGIEINPIQQYLLRILRPIMTLTPYGREIYGDASATRLYNPLLREFLSLRSPSAWLDALYGSAAAEIERSMCAEDGLLTAADLQRYEVVRREPVIIPYRGHEVITNPPPSFGGALLRVALDSLDDQCFDAHMSEAHRIAALADAMRLMNEHRQGTTGTTHLSVIDREGNAVSLTSSNGANSGCFAGSTGIMFNNMMGEDDLHPEGFHSMPPGLRVGSMMSPTVIRRDARVRYVLGSGGSKRIRTAMLQSIHNLIDRGMPLQEAIEAPRVHLDDTDTLQCEPGIEAEHLAEAAKRYAVNQWERKDLYFGGVHGVSGDGEGWGDSRRGGVAQTIRGK